MPQVLTPVIDPAILQQAELVLWAAGSQYRAGQPLNSAAIRTALGLGSAATKELTSWVTYTPTFTGFGTVTGISIWSRRIGDTLHIRGRFSTGAAPSAVEARMTLGFNGVNGGITSDATKVSAIQHCGNLARAIAGDPNHYALIESNVGYLTFGYQNATNASLTKQLGNAMFSPSQTFSLMAEIPISGW